jgi:hypothetical protein
LNQNQNSKSLFCRSSQQQKWYPLLPKKAPVRGDDLTI